MNQGTHFWETPLSRRNQGPIFGRHPFPKESGKHFWEAPFPNESGKQFWEAPLFPLGYTRFPKESGTHFWETPSQKGTSGHFLDDHFLGYSPMARDWGFSHAWAHGPIFGRHPFSEGNRDTFLGDTPFPEESGTHFWETPLSQRNLGNIFGRHPIRRAQVPIFAWPLFGVHSNGMEQRGLLQGHRDPFLGDAPFPEESGTHFWEIPLSLRNQRPIFGRHPFSEGIRGPFLGDTPFPKEPGAHFWETPLS
jgi:hypothetical protein